MAKNLNIDLKNINIKQLLGSLKNIDLSSVKKYSSLFPSIGLLLIAGCILIVTLLVGGGVNKKMSQRVQVANEIRSKIDQVPSEASAAEVEQYYQRYAEDADKVDAMAEKTSLRELICYDPVIFPEPTDKSTQVYDKFGIKYRLAIEKLLEKVQAKDAPSDAEIRSRTGQSMGGGEGEMRMLGGTSATSSVAQTAMVDAICMQRANEIPVYANPAIFRWYAFWEKYTYKSKEQALLDCWYSQVAYWVYEDVIQTIGVLNTGSGKIAQSPVKRLMGVCFDGPVQAMSSTTMGGGEMFMSMGSRGTEQQDVPLYVYGASNFLPIPWTGRMCNGDIDVIHFAVSVVVDSKSVASFMRELCSAKPHTFREKFDPQGKQESASHNQITILQFYSEPVFRSDAIHAYYQYGTNAVVRLNLVCEYIFVRKAYDGIKPEPVKKLMGGATTQPGM